MKKSKQQKPKKLCSICNGSLGKGQKKLCGSEKCFNEYYGKKELTDDDTIQCMICNSIFSSNINFHLTSKHKLNTKEYKELYPDALLYSPNYIKNCSDRVKGEKNPGYNHGGKLSPYSTKFKKYDTLEDVEKEQVIQELKTRQCETMRLNANYTTTLEYYLKLGMSEEEAIKTRASRHSFTLEKCIDKYGAEKGKEIWQARQDKWLTTMRNKPEEEIKRINSLKSSSIGCISNAEKELFEELSKTINVSKQFVISKDKGYVYDIRYENKIIEYNGDYWHCNPNIYQEDFFNKTIKKTAREIWEKDSIKSKYAKDNGYDMLVIWESDYKINKQENIRKCLNFLTQ